MSRPRKRHKTFIKHGKVRGDVVNDYFARLRSFGENVPSTKGISQPRQEVAQTLKRLWQGDFQQGYEDWHCHVLYESAKRTLKMFFYANKYFFVEQNFTENYIRRSAIYPSKTWALRALHAEHVLWYEKY